MVRAHQMPPRLPRTAGRPRAGLQAAGALYRSGFLGMRCRAFSLVELSIVLVILGLLVGGILAGQSLIRASELRAASSEGTRYRTAVYAFKDKYLPCRVIWPTPRALGVAAGSGSDSVCGNFASTTTATCDGNADGVVLSWVVTFGEMFRFWQHLANAGLIEGQYTGAPNATTPLYTVGRNVPASKSKWRRMGHSQHRQHPLYRFVLGQPIGWQCFGAGRCLQWRNRTRAQHHETGRGMEYRY